MITAILLSGNQVGYRWWFIAKPGAKQVPYQQPTLSAGLMSLLSHVTPVIFILVLCTLRALQREGFNTGLKSQVPPQRLRQFKIPPAVAGGLFYTGYFFFGACLMGLLNKGVAHMVGRLSPNFLDVCKPDYSEKTSVFTRQMCTGAEEDIVKASLSFPSEYAAHLSYGLLFNTAVVSCIPQLRKVPMTRLLCLFILVVLPILGGLSRYAEGFNHLVDVIVGIAVGFASSAFIVLSPLRLFGTLESTNRCTNEETVQPEDSKHTSEVTFQQTIS